MPLPFLNRKKFLIYSTLIVLSTQSLTSALYADVERPTGFSRSNLIRVQDEGSSPDGFMFFNDPINQPLAKYLQSIQSTFDITIIGLSRENAKFKTLTIKHLNDHIIEINLKSTLNSQEKKQFQGSSIKYFEKRCYLVHENNKIIGFSIIEDLNSNDYSQEIITAIKEHLTPNVEAAQDIQAQLENISIKVYEQKSHGYINRFYFSYLEKFEGFEQINVESFYPEAYDSFLNPLMQSCIIENLSFWKYFKGH